MNNSGSMVFNVTTTTPPGPTATVYEDNNNSHGHDYYNRTGIPEDCPDFSQADIELMDSLGYWVEGIIQTSLAVIGLFFNIISREASMINSKLDLAGIAFGRIK